MKIIALSQGKHAIVDVEDYDYLMQWKWHYDHGYAIRTQCIKGDSKRKRLRNRIYMHRVIMNTPDGMETDHINGVGLDNRRCNLRICNRRQNSANQRKTRGISKYKGVTWDKSRGLWSSGIGIGEKRINLGRFFSEEEAALVYNQAARELRGEFARLNEVAT